MTSSHHTGRVVVWGLLAHAPFGGMVWQVLHHLAGLRSLGYDVWYVEDSDQRMLNLGVTDWVSSAQANANHVRRYLETIGLGDKWIVRSPSSRECFGARDWNGLLRLYRESDVVINLCGSHELRPHHDEIRALLYLETDPVENQVALASGVPWKMEELSRYAALATYATNLGGRDCRIPETEHRWISTVPPVVPGAWRTERPPARRELTTIMNWSSPERAVSWNGEKWAWSKRDALLELSRLPGRSSAPLAMAMRQADPSVRRELAEAGWSVSDARGLDRPGAYRRFVRGSLGELSVAKQQYVAPRSGWISDRTVCYLAAGRPAIVERTGVAGVPVGEGLLDFADADEATDAIDAVLSAYSRHAVAARELAETHFSADRVLGSLMSRAGFGT
jgi:hypothetical protein